MPDFIGDTNHPYYPNQGMRSGPTAMDVFLKGNNPTTTPLPGTTIPTSTTNLPTNPGNLAAGLATDTAQSNLAASPYMKQLSDLINQTNAAAQQSINAGRFGGAGTQAGDQYQSNTNQFLSNIGAGAKGLIPNDVVNQIFANVAGGARSDFGVDSGATNAAIARVLGITSLQQQKDALAQQAELASLNPLPTLYNMQDQLVSPGTYAGTQQAQNALNQNAQQFADELKFKYYAAQLAAQNRALGGHGGGGYPSGGGGGSTGVQIAGGRTVPYSPTVGGGTPTTGGGTLPPDFNTIGNPYDPTGGLGGIPTFSTGNPNFPTNFPDYSGYQDYGPGAPTNSNDFGDLYNQDWYDPWAFQ